jgi:hypothetical protein
MSRNIDFTIYPGLDKYFSEFKNTFSPWMSMSKEEVRHKFSYWFFQNESEREVLTDGMWRLIEASTVIEHSMFEGKTYTICNKTIGLCKPNNTPCYIIDGKIFSMKLEEWYYYIRMYAYSQDNTLPRWGKLEPDILYSGLFIE